MNKVIIVGLFSVVLLAGGAYWTMANKPAESVVVNQMPATSTNSGEGAQEGSGGVHGLPVEPAAAEARKDLAQKLGVSANSIVILKVEEKTWSDGCLGLGGAAESCLMALVDGFRVEMTAKGKTYVYRTDKTGASLRAETAI